MINIEKKTKICFFFKFCRQGKIPKYLKKIPLSMVDLGNYWLFWSFARPCQVIQTVQRDIYYWKLFFLPIILYWFKRIVEFYELDAKQQKKYHFRSSDLMCKEKIVEFELRYSIHVKGISRKQADYNGKKLIWLLVSVGKSKNWPKTGSSFVGKLEYFFLCRVLIMNRYLWNTFWEVFHSFPVYFYWCPIIQHSTSPWISQG